MVRKLLWPGAAVLVAAAIALGLAAKRTELPGERAGAAPGAQDSSIDAILASPGYAATFDDAYRRIIASRRYAMYEIPKCIALDEGWKYRNKDKLRPYTRDVDWSDDGAPDSNWSWRHHSLLLIHCYMALYLEDGDPAHIEDLRAVIKDWVADNTGPEGPRSRFAWGDHSTALRLREVIELYAELRHRNLLSAGFARELVEFVRQHTDRLLRDPRIRRVEHNHALDQVNALALSHQFFPFLEYPGIDLQAEIKARFTVERDHLIARDGVATENSPAYHMWVPTRIAIMEDTLGLVAGAERGKVLAQRDGSLSFATWIEKPDGSLPQIGDTAPGKSANIRIPGQSTFPSYPEYVYAQSGGARGRAPSGHFKLFPDAGYLVYRDDWRKPLGDDTHLVVKCGFLANGHRHSDDGTFVLSSSGQEWFIDTGMFGYQAGTKRAHALSAAAHNISYLDGATVTSTASRQYRRYGPRWGLSGFEQAGAREASVTCSSFMFPTAAYQRHFAISPGRITLRDHFAFDGASGAAPRTRFHVPAEKAIEIAGPGVRICADDGLCSHIAFDADGIARVRVIEGGDDAFRTVAYLKTAPIKVIEFQWAEGVRSNDFEIAYPVKGSGNSAPNRLPASPR